MQAADTSNVGEQIAELDFRAAFEDSQSKVMGWVEGFITHLPNIVAALLIFAIFMIVARIVRGGVSRVLRRVSGNAAKPSCASRKHSTAKALRYRSRSAHSISARSVAQRFPRHGRSGDLAPLTGALSGTAAYPRISVRCG